MPRKANASRWTTGKVFGVGIALMFAALFIFGGPLQFLYETYSPDWMTTQPSDIDPDAQLVDLSIGLMMTLGRAPVIAPPTPMACTLASGHSSLLGKMISESFHRGASRLGLSQQLSGQRARSKVFPAKAAWMTRRLSFARSSFSPARRILHSLPGRPGKYILLSTGWIRI